MKTILLFDQLEGNYLFLKDLVSSSDAEEIKLDWTSSFREALNALEQGLYDLYLLSYESGGLQLLHAARKDKERIPALLIQRYNDERMVQRVHDLGALGCLSMDGIRLQPLRSLLHTSLRQADAIRAVSEGDERLRLALKAARMVAWDWDVPKDELRYSSEPSMVTGRISYGLRHKFITFLSYVHEEDREAVNQSIQNILVWGSDYDFEYRIRASDGKVRWVRSVAKVFRSAEGDPLRMTGIVMDVTEKREAANQILRMNELLEARVQSRTAELEASNKELEAFAYSVSHDLRVPLQAIYGFLEILMQGRANEEKQQEYLQKVKRNAERMNALIDDLLALSRVTRTKLEQDWIDLSEMVKSIHRDIQFSAKGRWVHLDVQESIGGRCDASMIKIALENLIGNAWKYTGKTLDPFIIFGTFHIEDKMVYFVKDNGDGFDRRAADKLFQPFQRFHTERQFTGTGVGLATVERVITRHGGEIDSFSEPGKGASFFFTLHEALPDRSKIKGALDKISPVIELA
ncbi:MAG: PAS domain-containing protein [Bacteroidetes Order II. Incertae sedis bacterium]|nr:PAS domain-containing protein [Bacteroidetes Order II. bacterium]